MTASAENQPSDNEPSSLENPPTTNHNGSAGKNRRGIGRAIAIHAAKAGYDIIFSYRTNLDAAFSSAS